MELVQYAWQVLIGFSPGIPHTCFASVHAANHMDKAQYDHQTLWRVRDRVDRRWDHFISQEISMPFSFCVTELALTFNGIYTS